MMKIIKQSMGKEQPKTVEPLAQCEVIIIATEKLVPYPRNPRRNEGIPIDRMVASIREFGFKIPVLARSDGAVIDGHLRLKAALKLGIERVPVILCDEWSDAQVKAFRLMVNRSVAWAEWDEELLKLEIEDLKALNFDLELTGFDGDELTKLFVEPNVPDASAQMGDMEYRIVVDCRSEQHQTELLRQFERDGLKCQPLIS